MENANLPQVSDEQLQEWLGLTEHQLRTLLTVYFLEHEGKDASPSAIIARFNQLYKQYPYRQNLAIYLRTLIEKGYIRRTDRGRYSLNTTKIEQVLNIKVKDVYSEFNTITTFSSDFIKQLDELYQRKNRPQVMYAKEDEYMDMMAENLVKAEHMYVFASLFPNVAYPQTILKRMKRKEWYEAIHRSVAGKTRIHYLTSLIPRYPYQRILSITNKHKVAYTETLSMLDRLEDLVNNNPNVEARYWEHALGAPMFILEGPNLGEVFFSLRGSEYSLSMESEKRPIKMSYPGVYVNSIEVAKNAKESFYSFYNRAIDLSSPQGRNIIENARKQFIDSFSG